MDIISISLSSIDDVRDFVNTVSRMEGDFDVVSGRYVIDAKSILGIFSLDLSKPLNLKFGKIKRTDRKLLNKYEIL